MRNALVVLTLALVFLPLQALAESDGSAEGAPLATPLVAPPLDHPHKIVKSKAAHVKIRRSSIPPEVQAALQAYIAKTEGDAKGLIFLGPPRVGMCGSTEVCENVWYLQKFLGPHGEIGGEAIITATLKRPCIFSVVTLAAGAADSVDGFATFDVPASVAAELLRPPAKIVPKKRIPLHHRLQRKMHGLGHKPKSTATPMLN